MADSIFKASFKERPYSESWVSVLESQVNDAEKRRYAKALNNSLSIDMGGDDTPTPPSPRDIAKRHGYNLKAQASLGISLQKPTAEKFLNEINCPTINSTFKNQYNKTTYISYFSREPDIIYKRQILLTYAEWLQLVDHSIRVNLPPEFEQYLT